MTYQDKTGTLMAEMHGGQDAFNDMLVTAMAQAFPKRLTAAITKVQETETGKNAKSLRSVQGTEKIIRGGWKHWKNHPGASMLCAA